MTNETRAADDANSKEEVEVGNKASLERWSKALGVTGEALESAVQAVGPRVDRIKDYLAAGMAGEQEDA